MNVNSVQHSSEIYNTFVCPTVLMKKSDHDVKLNWRRQDVNDIHLWNQ